MEKVTPLLCIHWCSMNKKPEVSDCADVSQSYVPFPASRSVLEQSTSKR
jgi:hypothetical protein